MKILVFTEGTIVDDRMQTARWNLFGNAAAKLRAWQRCGATIVYLTSKKTSENIEKVRTALKDGGAPMAELFFRIGDEDYGQVASRIAPDVIVEDDCKSIGGEIEMTSPKLPTELRAKVKQIVVPEFGGIDHLPDDPSELIDR
ncbi:MAG: hypothetical protein QXQ39_05320 [Conexivisphaerales archaeon]